MGGWDRDIVLSRRVEELVVDRVDEIEGHTLRSVISRGNIYSAARYYAPARRAGDLDVAERVDVYEHVVERCVRID